MDVTLKHTSSLLMIITTTTFRGNTMKEKEILGLVVLVYDYEPSPNNAKRIRQELKGSYILAWRLVVPVNEYLKRKGYFDKYEGRPTKKLYKLLKKHNVKIPQLKVYQDEYEETGHVTQYDKQGNKHIL